MAQENNTQENGASSFEQVFKEELKLINARRKAQAASGGPRRVSNDESKDPGDLVGLAFSGGGIRSAAFCLGAVQAMEQVKGASGASVFSHADYLSTVSGGGYTGASLSAGIALSGGAFPFPSDKSDQRDSASLGHVRNYSNYLIPHGFKDFLLDIAVAARGLTVNFLTVMMAVLIFASLTLSMKPTRAALRSPSFLWFDAGEWGADFFGQFFVFTKIIILASAVFMLLWALARSLQAKPSSEFSGLMPLAGAACLAAIAAAAFMEAQPFVLEGLFIVAAQQFTDEAFGGLGTTVAAWVKRISALAAPLAGLTAILSRVLGDVITDDKTQSTFKKLAAGASAKALSLVMALLLPLLIWFAYLMVTFWGLKFSDCAEITGIAAEVKERGLTGCLFVHRPDWMLGIHKLMSGYFGHVELLHYLVPALAFLGLSLVLRPNANALHRLYRDRLSKAFLFNPLKEDAKEPGDRANADQLKLTDLTKPAGGAPEHLRGPYHLINAALNVQGSKAVNKRGRNADFFIFGPKFSGSEATGYRETAKLEKAVRDLDLAAAMAISGAAASSNMGANSMRLLTPTLALLNVRLGFWMTNPKFAGTAEDSKIDRSASHVRAMYHEIFSKLDEKSGHVYLTDGGHIENLGVYELLKRRCKLIIAVDAESDEGFTFPSLITLQRYARIDLGVRIDLPWAEIAAAAKAAKREGGQGGLNRPNGPHAALGTIRYSGGAEGYLLYIKASLTGDENDYILDYARRHPAFPHETTSDQFFSEEQFEAYRALGFHAARGAFEGRDVIAELAPAPKAAGAPAQRSPALGAALKLAGV